MTSRPLLALILALAAGFALPPRGASARVMLDSLPPDSVRAAAPDSAADPPAATPRVRPRSMTPT